jgi:hypothetical protein
LVIGGNQQLPARGEKRATGEKRAIYTGVRAERINVTRATFAQDSVFMEFEDYVIDAHMPADSELQWLIEQVREDILRPEDLAVVGVLGRDYTVAEAAHWAVESVRGVTSADVVLLTNSLFGAGLDSGPLYNYRFNEFFPFDVGMVRATVDSTIVRSILSIANLDASTPVRPLQSSFVYASNIRLQESRLYTLVTSAEVALYAQWLLGTTQIKFVAMPETTVKALLRTALAEQGSVEY